MTIYETSKTIFSLGSVLCDAFTDRQIESN